MPDMYLALGLGWKVAEPACSSKRWTRNLINTGYEMHEHSAKSAQTPRPVAGAQPGAGCVRIRGCRRRAEGVHVWTGWPARFEGGFPALGALLGLQPPDHSMSLEIRIAGRYKLGRKIGSGSFGDIYLGEAETWQSSIVARPV